MRAKRDAAKSHEHNQRCSPEDANRSKLATLEQRQQKKEKLSVKQSGTYRMPTGKTVTRPINKRAVHKWPVPMNQNLDPLVQQHAAWNGNNQRHQRRPGPFPYK